MTSGKSGLHHITAITRSIQANIDFYVGFLGLRLVKRTAGFEDATQLHLFYGDAISSPGSLVTFLAWEDGSPGRVGHGAPYEIGLAVSCDAIGFWLTRALQFGISTQGPAQEFGEPVLRLKDPDGIIIKLIGVEDLSVFGGKPWTGEGVPEEYAIVALRNGTILTEKPAETIAFLTTNFGLETGPVEGSQTRLTSATGGVVDVRDATGFWTAAPGTGTIDHIALNAPDIDTVHRVAERIEAADGSPTNAHDRKYFYSLYAREPGGALIEFATDEPGFMLDESEEALGTTLFIPPHWQDREADSRAMLPQFSLPGEPRIRYRELPFVHRIVMPETPDDQTLVLLHGSGGNETSLLPFARVVAPDTMLLAVRGRATEEGVPRFFRRFEDGSFDQKDIASEAEAFVEMVGQLKQAYGVDPEKTTFVGQSNGANFLAAVMLLHPGVIRRAVLMRPVLVLGEVPAADVSNAEADVLIVAGDKDSYAAEALKLMEILAARSADVTMMTVDAGHDIVEADRGVVGKWLRTEK
ncbi:ring-cleaving dioxygenase [Rhizobiales bacterium RZME27]|uniref:Ring-cleaving dioxygenase n=1 Tax=Endobacterium cereale TaxID=2663029 RepID=A0A6A8AE50_9HYPH|nr:VOC family protein [Endobacterium cereale]MEB2847097.1 VOC family protein [Endobacterium cereale]MQY47486.1 ring-cleaving dioxygenase [Endobacterium cereale]